MRFDSALFITPRWARDGGVGAHVQVSAAALVREGVSVTVLAGEIESARIPGVTICQREQLCDQNATIETRLGDVLAHPYAIAHLHQIDDPAIVASARAVSPVVISAHGYTACTSGVHYFRPGQECGRRHGPGCIPNLLRCAHLRNPASLPGRYRRADAGLRALQLADLAVSYSSAVDRHLAANGIAHRAVVPYFPTVEASASGPGSGRRVLFAGRVVAAKGIAVLIRAAREVDADFVICGGGRELEHMRALARRLGVERRVRFTGWVEPQTLADELADASVLALPSLWPEPFGLVGIEAHACGRPVVASATGGVGDWLEHGISGLCVRPGDARGLARALTELLDDPERRQSMGEAGRRSVAARFSIEHHLKALFAGYRFARASWSRARADAVPEPVR